MALKRRSHQTLFPSSLMIGSAVVLMTVGIAFFLAKDRGWFPSSYPSPNLRENGFLFIPDPSDPAFYNHWKIDDAGRYCFLGRVHYRERRDIVGQHFAPIRR